MFAIAMFCVFGIAMPSSAQVQFHGIPSSVTSPTFAPNSGFNNGFNGFNNGFNNGFGFSNCCSVFGGQTSFGHNRRFNNSFGAPFPRRHRRLFNGSVIVPYAVPYPSYGYGPYGDDQYSNYEQSQPQNPSNNQSALIGEIQSLRDEVTNLREENQQRSQLQELQKQQQQIQNQNETTQRRGSVAPSHSAALEAPPTILVLRNGQILEAHNYAIVGKTVWVISEQHARKILLTDLNIPATEQRNEEQGTEFRLPPGMPGK